MSAKNLGSQSITILPTDNYRMGHKRVVASIVKEFIEQAKKAGLDVGELSEKFAVFDGTSFHASDDNDAVGVEKAAAATSETARRIVEEGYVLGKLG